MIMMMTDIHAMGLKTSQGMVYTDGFYWDLNPETRAWSKRFFERHKRMPTMIQAGLYSAVTTTCSRSRRPAPTTPAA